MFTIFPVYVFIYTCISFFSQTGDIVMFTGLMEVLDNDDQVAAILAHEMSHAILDHAVSIESLGWEISCISELYLKGEEVGYYEALDENWVQAVTLLLSQWFKQLWEYHDARNVGMADKSITDLFS